MGLTLAKLNIVSPAILDSSDIGEFRDRQIDVNLIELLEVSSIIIFQNSEILHFLIKFRSPKFICKNSLSGSTPEKDPGLRKWKLSR